MNCTNDVAGLVVCDILKEPKKKVVKCLINLIKNNIDTFSDHGECVICYKNRMLIGRLISDINITYDFVMDKTYKIKYPSIEMEELHRIVRSMIDERLFHV